MSGIEDWQRALPRVQRVMLALQVEIGLSGICPHGRYRRFSTVCPLTGGQPVGLYVSGEATGRTGVVALRFGEREAFRGLVAPSELRPQRWYRYVKPVRLYQLLRISFDVVGPCEGLILHCETEAPNGNE